MTTVAYRDGVIASDSQVTSGDVRVGTAIKCGNKNGVLYGFAGCLAFVQAFQAWIERGMEGDPPAMKKDDSRAEAILIHDGHILSYDDDGWDRLKADYYAIGSGRMIALGAMAAGASAVEAVEAAILHDVYSGGDVVSFEAAAAVR